MADLASASFTTFESTSDVLQSILDDGTCPSHPEEELNVFCFTDKSFMCLKCSITHKGHHITTFSSPEEGQMIIQKVTSIIYCSKHIDKQAQYYCLKEERPVCEMCCIVTCKSHEVEEIRDLSQKYKDQLDQLTQKINDDVSKKGDLNEFIQRADSLTAKLTDKEIDQIKKVEEYFDKLEESLKEKRQEMVDYAKGEMKEVCSEMYSFVNSMKQIQEWEDIHKKLIQSGDMELINYCRSEKMTDLESFVEDFEHSGDDNLEMLKGEGFDEIGVILDDKYKFSDLHIGFLGGMFSKNSKAFETVRYIQYGQNTMVTKEFDGSNQQSKSLSLSDSVYGGREMAVTPKGDIWLYGGTDMNGYCNSNKMWCLKGGEGTPIEREGPPGMNGNAYFTFLAAPDNTLWVVGGYGYNASQQTYYDQVYQYEVSKDKWVEKPKLDTRLYYHSGAVYNKGSKYMIYIFGGYNMSQYVHEVRVFNHSMKGSDIALGKWEKLALSSGFNYNYMSGVIGASDRDEIYIFGTGGSNSWKFDVKEKKFTSITGYTGCSWSYTGYWARKDNLLAWTGDNGTSFKYDMDKKIATSL